MSVKDGVRWFQEHLGFINRLPSWLNELLSGFLCVAIALGVTALIGMRALTFPVAFVLSEMYEHWLDPWGWNADDVVERSRGIVLLMVVWAVIRGF